MLPFFEGVVLPGDFTFFVKLLTAWSFALDLFSFVLVLVMDSVSDSFLSVDFKFLENELTARILAPDLRKLELVDTLPLLLLPLPLFPALLLSKAFIAFSTPVGFFHAVLDRAGAVFLSWTLLEKLLTARILAPDLRRELLLVFLSCSMLGSQSTTSCC